MAIRGFSLKTIANMEFETLPFTGIYAQAMGQPETNGCWLVYGAEKNGKTWWSLMLADYLSTMEKTLFISGEMGIGRDLKEAAQRANVDINNKNLMFLPYTPITELDEKLKVRKAAKIILIDNLTTYADELTTKGLARLLKNHPDKLFVFIAHEEKGEVTTGGGKHARKLAKIIMRIQGLTAIISGRCAGGKISIDKTKAALYWGEPEIITN